MAAPAASPAAPPKPLMIAWHGREGRHGKDKSIFTIQLEAKLNVVSDESMKAGIKSSPGRELKLMPGLNPDISADDWSKAQKIAVVKVHVDEGRLEVVEGIDQSLMGVTQTSKAVDFVKYTIDRNLLDRWRRADTRAEVLKAIEAHVAELSAVPAKQ